MGELSEFFPFCPSLPPSTSYSLRQFPHYCSCPWFMNVSSLATPFPIWYLHPHGCSVTTYLCYLIHSPLHPIPQPTISSGNHQNALHIHDSFSILLVCLVCFLDSIVAMYFLPLLFIVLTFIFFLK